MACFAASAWLKGHNVVFRAGATGYRRELTSFGGVRDAIDAAAAASPFGPALVAPRQLSNR
jgi:hypothetical protein